jgi:hypothetical protein
MDKIVGLAKDSLGDRLHGSPDASTLPAGNKTHGGAPLTFVPDSDDEDDEKVAKKASNHAGPSGSSSLFTSVLGVIGQNKPKIEQDEDSDIDEDYAVKKHKKNFKKDEDDDDEVEDDKALGTAAAIQALQLFTQGQTGENKQSQGTFMALAMAEATKLFDAQTSSGKVAADASKETTVQKAGEMALKLYLQSQGKKKGGSQSFLSLASKFM